MDSYWIWWFAALLCSASVAGIYFWKRKVISVPQSNFAYGVGQTVQIASWSDTRNARVSYLGAEWHAELADTALIDAEKTSWRIKAIEGSLLIIE